MSRKSDAAETALVAALVIVGGILLVVGIFLLYTGFTALIIWLAWNVLGLHELFNAEPLSTLHIFAVAIVLNIIRGLFSASSSSSATAVANRR